MRNPISKILRTILVNLLVFGVTVILLLGSYEVYLRVQSANSNGIKTVIDRPIYVSDPDLGWFHKRNMDFDYMVGTSSLNEFGHRSSVNPSAKNRILMLGDSFVFGMNVRQDQTFSSLMQEKLNSKEWNVMNAGVIGYTIHQELIYLRREFDNLNPQTVVLNLFVGNDLTEQRRNNVKNDDSGMPIQIHDSEVMVNEKGQLSSYNTPPLHSLALADILRRWREIKIQKKAYPGYTWGVFLSNEHPYYPADMDALWREYEASLNLMAAFLAERKVHFLVVVIPMDVQVSKAYLDKYPNRVFEEKEFEEQVPQKKLWAICERNHLNCLDLLPVFQQNASRQLYFASKDPHFDVPGNKLTADTILDELSRLHFLQ